MDQLRALRVFAKVVAEGSFAGAARVMDLAPAVVTRTVADLEAHLGARLLQRSTRRLALTDTGHTYLGAAHRLLADLDAADAQAGAASAQAAGTLRVIAPPAFAVHQLARHLPRFRALYPRVSLDIVMPGAVEAADENFDVSIISVGQQPLQGDFTVRRLACSTFVLCAAPAYLAQRGHPAHPDDLLQHDGLLPAVAAVRRQLTLYRSAGPGRSDQRQPEVATIPTPTPVLSSGHIEMLLAAALAGLGIAGLPSFVADAALHDGRLQRVLPQWHGGLLTLYAALPSRRHLPARTRAWVDFLVGCFGGTEHDPWLPQSPGPVAAPADRSMEGWSDGLAAHPATHPATHPGIAY